MASITIYGMIGRLLFYLQLLFFTHRRDKSFAQNRHEKQVSIGVVGTPMSHARGGGRFYPAVE